MTLEYDDQGPATYVWMMAKCGQHKEYTMDYRLHSGPANSKPLTFGKVSHGRLVVAI
jgi:hypothetical protein